MDYYDDDGDFSDDFDDDSGDDGDFMDDDSMEDAFDDDSGIENEPLGDDDMCDEEFTVEDAVMTGVAFGWGYEEGMEEAKRRKLEKKMQDDRDKRNNRS